MSNLLAALRLEMFLARYSLAARITVLAPALVCLARFLLVWLNQAGQQARAGLIGASDFELAQAQNAYGHFVDGVNTGLAILALLLVATAAHDLSGERDVGSIRHVLIRRAGRTSIVLAKLLRLHVLGLLALALLGLCAWAGSALFWDFGPVVEDGFELISENEIRYEIRLGLLMAVMTPARGDRLRHARVGGGAIGDPGCDPGARRDPGDGHLQVPARRAGVVSLRHFPSLAARSVVFAGSIPPGAGIFRCARDGQFLCFQYLGAHSFRIGAGGRGAVAGDAAQSVIRDCE